MSIKYSTCHGITEKSLYEVLSLGNAPRRNGFAEAANRRSDRKPSQNNAA